MSTHTHTQRNKHWLPFIRPSSALCLLKSTVAYVLEAASSQFLAISKLAPFRKWYSPTSSSSSRCQSAIQLSSGQNSLNSLSVSLRGSQVVIIPDNSDLCKLSIIQHLQSETKFSSGIKFGLFYMWVLNKMLNLRCMNCVSNTEVVYIVRGWCQK